ncbi:hypothetical protein DPMN_139837 [Dreissena polymorpha]|uniref:Uncharacterized protein n=1 Tax=Dreissena polymorpha TaxID=45954 RepID=A0A9D4GCE0_DREPO|nr:hypothetical protein DPMN_139837 [Dreissena polymorpha]
MYAHKYLSPQNADPNALSTKCRIILSVEESSSLRKDGATASGKSIYWNACKESRF